MCTSSNDMAGADTGVDIDAAITGRAFDYSGNQESGQKRRHWREPVVP